MARMNGTTDIKAYYDAARLHPVREETSLGASAESWMTAMETPANRWPIRNREERLEVPSQKRAIIHARDGGHCRYCPRTGKLVVDHIIPRSTFPPEDLQIADRSDNLASACWECNEDKSNFENEQTKLLGVTVACFYCQHPEHRDETGDDDTPQVPHPVEIPAFCGRCGKTSRVPDLTWIL